MRVRSTAVWLCLLSTMPNGGCGPANRADVVPTSEPQLAEEEYREYLKTQALEQQQLNEASGLTH